jgi:hypothetical protein
MILMEFLLFHEDKINRADDEQKGEDMVPVEVCALKHNVRNDTEHRNGNALLNHFKLNDVEGTSVAVEAETVGGHLTTVFKEGDSPREGYHSDEWPVGRRSRLLQFQMTIPCQRHEDVAQYEQ